MSNGNKFARFLSTRPIFNAAQRKYRSVAIGKACCSQPWMHAASSCSINRHTTRHIRSTNACHKNLFSGRLKRRLDWAIVVYSGEANAPGDEPGALAMR